MHDLVADRPDVQLGPGKACNLRAPGARRDHDHGCIHGPTRRINAYHAATFGADARHLGAVNGLLVAYGRVPAIVTTLGTLALYRVALVELSGAKTVTTDALPVNCARTVAASCSH